MLFVNVFSGHLQIVYAVCLLNNVMKEFLLRI